MDEDLYYFVFAAFFPCTIVLVIEERNFPISSESSFIDRYCFSFRYSVLYRSSIQYWVSRHSFAAMYSFDTKSARLIAALDSAMFAPMLVPERRSCLLSTYSFLSSRSHL